MTLVDLWNLASAVLATFGGFVLAAVGIAALFGMDWPQRPIPRVPDARNSLVGRCPGRVLRSLAR